MENILREKCPSPYFPTYANAEKYGPETLGLRTLFT